jgi:hypothetical protein
MITSTTDENRPNIAPRLTAMQDQGQQREGRPLRVGTPWVTKMRTSSNVLLLAGLCECVCFRVL